MRLLDRIETGREMSFAEFWRHYLSAHSKPGTRAAHYVATIIGIAAVIAAAYYGQPVLLVAGAGCAVALAVGSHWTIEHNQPLIRVNALYGAIADLRMCWLALTGRLKDEYRRLGLMD
jgi:hypothetical protein